MHHLTLGVETLRHGKGEVIYLWSGAKSIGLEVSVEFGSRFPYSEQRDAS